MKKQIVNGGKIELKIRTLVIVIVAVVLLTIAIILIFSNNNSKTDNSGIQEVEEMENISYMQDWRDCRSLTQDQKITLTDKRDKREYMIAKLKDDKCWMIENLKISDTKITPADSDISEDYTIPESNLTAFNVGSEGYKTNPNNQATYVDSVYGGYYTWQVATAGTGSSYTEEGQNAPSSICPKGWHLPSGGLEGEFAVLNKAYGGNMKAGEKLIASPIPGFTFSGTIDSSNGQMDRQGTNGYYWSSTSMGPTNASIISYISSMPMALIPSWSRTDGFTIRCISS